eukprot:IDg115t1
MDVAARPIIAPPNIIIRNVTGTSAQHISAAFDVGTAGAANASATARLTLESLERTVFSYIVRSVRGKALPAKIEKPGAVIE